MVISREFEVRAWSTFRRMQGIVVSSTMSLGNMTEALVTTTWTAKKLGTPGVHVIEVGHNGLHEYGRGHLPGASAIDWRRELIESESSSFVIDPKRFANLARRLAVEPDDTLIFYGDEGGRHACRALWTFQHYRHPGPLHLMDGGREKWQAQGRPLAAQIPIVEPSTYPIPNVPQEVVRATREAIEARLGRNGWHIVDARSREEYEGTEARAARGGHIPGATHVFWRDAVAEDSALKSKEELAALYAHVPKNGTVAVHCQLGIRSAHTWFVLHHVLDRPNVRNYDGSWQEWGNLPDTPIEL